MTFPFGLSQPYSLMSLLARFTTRSVTVYQPTEDIVFSTANCIMAADSYFPITYKVSILEDVFGIAWIVWAVVALSLIIAFGILYFGTLSETRDAVFLRDNVYFSPKVTAPALYGIVKPKIVLPCSYNCMDIKYITLHESVHNRRMDNLWRVLAFVAVSLHWFNPLAWVFLKAFLCDLELACDECAVRDLSLEERKEYARTLLYCAGGANVFVSSFGGAKIRTRIENIISFKKMTWLSLIGFISLLVAVLCILLTNAT